MSDRVENAHRDDSTTAADKRAAAKTAAAEAAAASRRRSALTGTVAGLAVVAALVALVVVLARSSDTPGGGITPAAAPTPAASEPAPAPTSLALPAGIDPALATKPTVRAGSGPLKKLTATPLVKGKGPAARAGQTITVNYVGVFYQTGDEFDSSWNGSEPLSFTLGQGNVIPGWDQGLIGAKVGSRLQLDIPAALAYGDNPGGGRPAGPLRFIVDVLAVR